MAKPTTFVRSVAVLALLLVPMLTWCKGGELTTGDKLSQVIFTVPSGELPAECIPDDPPPPDGGADADSTDDAETGTIPGCELTITLSPVGGGADISGTTPIDPDNSGEMTLSVAPGNYNVHARVENAADTLLYELGSATAGTGSPVIYTFVPGVTEVTLWLNQVVDDIPPSEFSPFHIVSLMATDNEPGDGGDEYRVETHGQIAFTVGVSAPDEGKTVTVSGSVSPATGNCGALGDFTEIADTPNMFVGTWQAGAIADVECMLTLTATETDSAGDVSRTAAISFMVWTHSGDGGTNRDFAVVYNTAPNITDISVTPSQINISSSPLENILITVTAVDREEQDLNYQLALTKSIRREAAEEVFECLLLSPSPAENPGEFFVTDPSWGDCPADDDGTEYLDYVEGSSVVVFEATVTEADQGTTDIFDALSAQGKLEVHVMHQSAAE